MSSGLAGAFDGLEGLFKMAGCLLIFFVPLGMWKLVDIAIWLWQHFHISIT